MSERTIPPPVSSHGEDFAEVVVVRHGETSANALCIIQLVLSPALRERHMGDLHGLKFDDAVRSKPDAYKAFSSEDRSQEIPGSE
uniref:Uncharacterized protein n=1 Tax=Oryza barthii TaxID=65489 RepID=A0A0D3HR55_9ORYZ